MVEVAATPVLFVRRRRNENAYATLLLENETNANVIYQLNCGAPDAVGLSPVGGEEGRLVPWERRRLDLKLRADWPRHRPPRFELLTARLPHGHELTTAGRRRQFLQLLQPFGKVVLKSRLVSRPAPLPISDVEESGPCRCWVRPRPMASPVRLGKKRKRKATNKNETLAFALFASAALAIAAYSMGK